MAYVPFTVKVTEAFYTHPAVDTSWRTPFQNPTQSKLPPAPFQLPVVEFKNGRPFIGNTPLGDAASQTGPGKFQSNAGAGGGVQPVVEPGRYGDSIIVSIEFTGPGYSSDLSFSPDGSIVLPRPQNYRSALLIQNVSVGGLIYYDYDKAATAASMPIGIGGSRNYSGDSVPQGNLSIFSSGAGFVVLEYMNITV